MPPHLIPGLKPEDASDICMNRCRAMCCRGQLILQLGVGEVESFRRLGTSLGVAVGIDPRPDGGGWVRFGDHPGERCPMLDGETFGCRIYDQRPQRCRDFPEKPTPGCAISGWTERGTG